MTNADGKQVIYLSPAYEKIWGWPPQSCYEQPESWLETVHLEDRERVAAAYMPES